MPEQFCFKVYENITGRLIVEGFNTPETIYNVWQHRVYADVHIFPEGTTQNLSVFRAHQAHDVTLEEFLSLLEKRWG